MNSNRSIEKLIASTESKAQITGNVAVYGLCHAIVDASCAAILFANFDRMQTEPGYFAFLVILYNVLAFALQAPLGLLIDRFRQPAFASAAGCLLIAISAVAFQYFIISIVLAGIGNAFFHIGGGVVTLSLSRGKASIPGIYVAPGALGLLAGTLIGKGGNFIVWPFAGILLLACLAILSVKCPYIEYDVKPDRNYDWLELTILLLLISILIRSVIGLALDFPWKSNIYLLMCLTLAVVLGKALGGILADRFGWIKISMVSLLVSAPLVSFGTDYPLLSIVGIFLFNMTMPITLTAVANMLPGKPGFAFGLTTLALIAGALPTFTDLRGLLGWRWVSLVTVLLSALALYISLNLYFKGSLSFNHKKASSVSAIDFK